MKTSYCLVTAAGVAAAALAVYTAQYPGWSGAQEVPPLPTRAAKAAEPPAVLGIADGGLPPIVMPPDAPLVVAVAGRSPEMPIPPMTPEPTLAVPRIPALPPVSATPLPKLPAPPAATELPAGPLPIPIVTPPAAPGGAARGVADSGRAGPAHLSR